MKVLKYIFTLFLVVSLTTVQAGIRRADRMFHRFDYAKAIPLYEKHIEKNPLDLDAQEKLAHCYRFVKDYENAEKWYRQACKKSGGDLLWTKKAGHNV